MEGITVNAYRGLRGYWKRRGYERLNGRKQRKPGQAELARMGRSKGRFWRWRIKLSRPKIRIGSPKNWLIKLRDAYVKMMLSFSNSAAFFGGTPGFAVDYGAFGRPTLKEYDEKVIVEIYKSLVMAQGKLVPREAEKISSAFIL